MTSLIFAIVILYVGIGVLMLYINREDKLNKFKITPQDIKSILLWYRYRILKKDKSL